MTLSDLKERLLKEANQIEGYRDKFTPDDADDAYSEATRECGFTFPLVGDADTEDKILWLNRRMRRYILFQCWMRNVNAMKSGDMEAQTLPVNYKGIVAYMDNEFAKAREEKVILSDAILPTTLAVYPTGIVEDRIGQSIEVRE